jgi:membrane associated rhomboid family serine protease
MLRGLIDEFKEFPATMALCALWVVVFVLMVVNQMAHGSVPTLGKLVLGIQGGHPFGEMTLDGLYRGEIWRPLTATFVHYGLLHIGLNLFMMYQLGALIESWYGPWQFLAVYAAIGYGGNLLSALIRHALGSNPLMASGGGSTVLLGLAALCAVVGWRSRTRIGDYLRSQMVGLLIATALLGQIVPIIDNWGHAGGALIGAMIGFAHRILIRTAHRPVAKWAGGLALILLVACGAAQVRDDLGESSRASRAARMSQTLRETWNFYLIVMQRSRLDHSTLIPDVYRRESFGSARVPAPETGSPESRSAGPLSPLDSPDEAFRAELKRRLDQLDAFRDDLGTGPTAADFRRFRSVLAQVLDRPPSDRVVLEMYGHLHALLRQAQPNQGAPVPGPGRPPEPPT